MGIILVIIAASVAGYGLWRAASAVFRLIAALLLVGVSVATALAIGVVAASVADKDPMLNAPAVGVAVGGLVLLLILLCARLADASRKRAPLQPVERSSLRQGEDEALSVAWGAAVRIMPAYGGRIEQARERCRAILVLADADPFDLDLALLKRAVLIRKHVPDLMRKAAKIWPDLEVRERKQHARNLIEALEKLSDSGEQLRTERRKSLIDDFKRLITHVEDRTKAAD